MLWGHLNELTMLLWAARQERQVWKNMACVPRPLDVAFDHSYALRCPHGILFQRDKVRVRQVILGVGRI